MWRFCEECEECKESQCGKVLRSVVVTNYGVPGVKFVKPVRWAMRRDRADVHWEAAFARPNQAESHMKDKKAINQRGLISTNRSDGGEGDPRVFAFREVCGQVFPRTPLESREHGGSME